MLRWSPNFFLEDPLTVYLRHLSAVLVCCSMAFGQAAAPMPPQAQPGSAAAAAPSTAQVPLDSAVITLKGVCYPAAVGCSTVVSRSDFEKIIQVVQPQMPFKMQRQVATGYSQLLSMSIEAKKRGLENSPRVQERAKIAVMQALQRELVETVQEAAGKISDADVEKYYNDHKSNYEQAEMQRLFVPNAPQPEEKGDRKVTAMGTKAGTKAGAAAKAGTAAKTTVAKPVATEATMKALATKLRARAVTGADFAKLQVEAFTAASIKAAAPDTKMAKVTRATLPPNHRAAFDLKTGDVSEIIPEGNGYYIYKMGAKSTQPLDDAKNEIRTALKGERMQQAMEAISKMGAPELNDAYFGPAEAAAPRGPGGMAGHPSSPQKAPEKE